LAQPSAPGVDPAFRHLNRYNPRHDFHARKLSRRLCRGRDKEVFFHIGEINGNMPPHNQHCLEEIPIRKSWISVEEIENIAKPMLKNGYG
jgi:hypothetical protein